MIKPNRLWVYVDDVVEFFEEIVLINMIVYKSQEIIININTNILI